MYFRRAENLKAVERQVITIAQYQEPIFPQKARAKEKKAVQISKQTHHTIEKSHCLTHTKNSEIQGLVCIEPIPLQTFPFLGRNLPAKACYRREKQKANAEQYGKRPA